MNKILLLLCLPLFASSQNIETEKLKLFLDCNWSCDQDFIKKEIPQIDFYRDSKSANLHVIIKSESSSNGGEIVNFRFIGVDIFEGVNNTLSLSINPNTSSDDKRRQYVDILKKGIYAYMIKTENNKHLKLTYSKSTAVEQKSDSIDKWNNWVFKIGASGWANGEEGYLYSSYNLNLSGNRITEASKFTSYLNYNSNTSTFDYDDFYLKTKKESTYAGITYVKSKSKHASYGIKSNYRQSSSINLKAKYSLSPCIEYNLYPYSESSEHRFSVLYGVTANYSKYLDSTIYLKTKEAYPSHLVEVNYSNSQTWGSFDLSIDGFQILDKEDMKKYNIRISTDIDWKIAKGLSLNLWSYINFDRAQIHLPIEGATYEDIILRQKELASNYNFYVNFGVNYTFGSMRNNIVNSRF